MHLNQFISLLVLQVLPFFCSCDYEPNWKSIDSRPLPSWYDESKIGVFITWGVFSVPSYEDEWFWYYLKHGYKNYVDFMKNNYPPGFTYPDFGPMFDAKLYDPHKWAELFNASGAKYIVFLTKHHDGFSNWPSKYSFNWNSGSIGPHRDLVGEMAKAVQQFPDIKFGLYHSLFEWFNPIWLQDQKNKFQTNAFVTGKAYPEMIELVEKYKPEVIWSDGDWLAPDWYWNSTKFLAWLYNESPVAKTVVVNDRWGTGTAGKHGGFFNYADRYNPGRLMPHKWENAFTIDQSTWGYSRTSDLKSYLSIEEILKEVISTVAYGGNALINVGPTHDGRILPVFEERLRQLGSWLKINGDSIYSTKPCLKHQNDTITPHVYYTCKNSKIFALLLDWPKDGILRLGSLGTCPSSANLFGFGPVPCQKLNQVDGGMKNNNMTVEIDLRPAVIALKTLKWSWVIQFFL